MIKVVVLTDHMPWGHRSIAKAIHQYLEATLDAQQFTVLYRQIKLEVGIVEDFYKLMYRFTPKVGQLSFKLEATSPLTRRVVDELYRKNLPAIRQMLEEEQPDLVISAHFFHSLTLVRLREANQLPYRIWTVVSDPWTVYHTTIVPGADLHLVYDGQTRRLAEGMGADPDKIAETGWWVRPQMYQDFDRQQARQALGFTDDRPVIFVGGGSLGTSSLTNFLPALFLIKEKVGFVFNSGTDKATFLLIERYRKLLNRMGLKRTVIIKNLGWIDNMAEVLTACDIVFGKAGPNFLFDVVATRKPFVAITHIGGQEDGNIDIIKQKNLGWIKENSVALIKFMNQYLKNPEWYHHHCRNSIDAEAQRNQQSLPMVRELVIKEFANGLPDR